MEFIDSSQPSHKATAGQATSRLRCAPAWQALGMTKGINYEAHEGHEDFVEKSGGIRLSHNFNLAVMALLSIAASRS